MKIKSHLIRFALLFTFLLVLLTFTGLHNHPDKVYDPECPVEMLAIVLSAALFVFLFYVINNHFRPENHFQPEVSFKYISPVLSFIGNRAPPL